MPSPSPPPLLLLLLFVGAAPLLPPPPGSHALVQSLVLRTTSQAGAQVLQGAAWWDLSRAFTTVIVTVECGAKEGDAWGAGGYRPGFKVFHGRTREEVEAEAVEGAGPSWGSWLGGSGGRACAFGVSPYGDTFVSVVQPSGIGAMGAGPFDCTVTRREVLAAWRLWGAVAGLLLVAMAVPLAGSMWFRLASGGLLSVVAFALLLLYFVGRQVPGKLPLVLLLSSTTVLGLMSLAGAWLPSWEELLWSPVFLGYLGVGATVGVVCTYLYFDPADMSPRAVRVLQGGIRAAGAVMLYTSCQSASLATALGAGALAWPAYGEAFAGACGRGAGAVLSLGVGADKGLPCPGGGEDPSPLRTEASSPRTPAAVPDGGSAAAHHEHSLVKSGKVLNLSSGRAIKIGGSTFNRLVESGYEFDRREGVLSPPPPAKALSFSPPRSSSPITRRRSAGGAGAR